MVWIFNSTYICILWQNCRKQLQRINEVLLYSLQINYESISSQQCSNSYSYLVSHLVILLLFLHELFSLSCSLFNRVLTSLFYALFKTTVIDARNLSTGNDISKSDKNVESYECICSWSSTVLCHSSYNYVCSRKEEQNNCNSSNANLLSNCCSVGTLILPKTQLYQILSASFYFSTPFP